MVKGLRVAIACAHGARAGGTEAYVADTLGWLARDGHEVAVWYEIEPRAGQERLAPPSAVRQACVGDRGVRSALADIADWRPDVIYAHGLYDARFERGLLETAPVVLRAHNYYGTCVSGFKTWRFPRPQPCRRRFGPACVAYYYPRRCGGLSAATMARDFVRQWQRLRFVRRCAGIIANSGHITRELIAHGVRPDRVHTLPPPAYPVPSRAPDTRGVPGAGDEVRLLFLGRLETLKGGDVLLDSLAAVRAGLGRPIRLTFAGDGPAQPEWQARARRLTGETEAVRVEFVGWVDGAGREALWRGSHLLVVPSVWPEPFGVVGVEAACHGVPAVAFDVGGISDWLIDGVNGRFARGGRPSAAGLAAAIVGCVRDPATYARLCEGARAGLARFAPDPHARAVIDVLRRAAAVAA